jgi:hypothetical protein
MTDDRRQHLNPAGVAAIPAPWPSSTPPPVPAPPGGIPVDHRPPLGAQYTKELHRQLRILGYHYPSVEWDGALAAARAYGAQMAMTTSTVALALDDARRLFDLAVDTPLLCSGSFETDDVVVLRRLATTIGVDPALATPDEFVRDFPHPFAPFRADMEREWVRAPGEPGDMRLETEAEVHARLGESPDRCMTGGYNRRCRRPADDPIHTAQMGAPS